LNKGIQTTEDALNYSTQLEHTWEKKKKVQKVNEPDWMDDYVKELEKMEETS
jgi:replication initiation and membrane attachment protein